MRCYAELNEFVTTAARGVTVRRPSMSCVRNCKCGVSVVPVAQTRALRRIPRAVDEQPAHGTLVA